MSYTVCQADIDAFNKDGALPLRGVISPRQLDQLAAAVEDDIREPGFGESRFSSCRLHHARPGRALCSRTTP